MHRWSRSLSVVAGMAIALALGACGDGPESSDPPLSPPMSPPMGQPSTDPREAVGTWRLLNPTVGGFDVPADSPFTLVAGPDGQWSGDLVCNGWTASLGESDDFFIASTSASEVECSSAAAHRVEGAFLEQVWGATGFVNHGDRLELLGTELVFGR